MNRGIKALRLSWAMAVALALFASSALADPPPQVVSAQSMGLVVMVKVKNPGSQPHGATVSVQASVLGLPVSGSAHVNLAPGQTANVPVAFLGLVQNIISVGLTNDDGAPF
jgi:hypothetical protein